MTLVTLLLVWAVFLQVILTFIVLLKMRKARFSAFKEKNMTMDQIAVDHSAWPDNVRQIQNNFTSQFELPVLFYLAVILTLMFGLESWFFVILCWAFVLSRFVHMHIHTGSNVIKHRFRSFIVGMACVTLQWLYIIGMATLAYVQSL